MSIPLVQNNEKDSINTSIIAIKRNIERINMLLGLVDSGSPDLSGLATKQELEDAITQVETDLTPVDEVTSGNMQSVTSNAVSEELDNFKNITIYKWWGTLKDNGSAQITLPEGYTWLYINTHVLNIELILFSFYESNIYTLRRIAGNSTSITALDYNRIKLDVSGNCRGYIFRIGNTQGT
jgi:hypothetical protein